MGETLYGYEVFNPKEDSAIALAFLEGVGVANKQLLGNPRGYLHLSPGVAPSLRSVYAALAMYCFLLASLVSIVDPPSPEQTAFDYFATVLVAQHYAQAKHLYVTGQSEATVTSKGPFAECFPETGFRTFWAAHAVTAATPIMIAYRKFPIFKRASAFNSQGLQVRIYRAFAGPEGTYTYITVSKRAHFTDHYLLKVSNSAPGRVAVCRQGEVW